MESILVLVAWMALGALSTLRFGPPGAVPVAIIFGPLWPAIAVDMKPAHVQDEQHLELVAPDRHITVGGDR